MGISQGIAHAVRLFISSDAIRQSFILTAGTTITGVIMAVALIIASNALGPSLFGIFSVSITLSFILSKFLDLGMHQLIPKLFNKYFHDAVQQKKFLAQVLYWKIILTGFTLVGGLSLTPVLTRLLNYPHPDLIVWAIIGGIIISWYEYVYVVLSGKHQFLEVSKLSIGQGLLKAIGIVSFFALGFSSVLGVVILYYIGPAVVLVFFYNKITDSLLIRPANAPDKLRSEIFSFLRHMLVGVLMMTLIANLDILMVQKYLNSFDTGVYSGASRIASFIGFIAASVGGVLSNRVARYKDPRILRMYLLKSLSIAGLAVLGFLLFLPFARLALVVTIGQQYLSGLPTLIILVLNAFLSLAIVPYSAFFYGVNHPKYFSVSGVLQVVIIFGINFIYLPQYGIMAAAVARTAANLVFLLFTGLYIWYALKKLKN